MLVCYWYINRKVFKIKIYWMQCFIIPLISVLPTFLLAKIWELWIIDFLINILGLYVSMGITLVVGMIISPLLIYLPLMAYLGGWDEKQMELFKKSVELSGPSKFFVKPFYKMTKYWVDKSKFHNKFKIPWKKADKEILELHLMKLNQDFVVPEEKDQNMELVGWFKKKFKNN